MARSGRPPDITHRFAPIFVFKFEGGLEMSSVTSKAKLRPASRDKPECKCADPQHPNLRRGIHAANLMNAAEMRLDVGGELCVSGSTTFHFGIGIGNYCG